jgi:outer membrane protein assembly factor BamD (BamD/ComL family)
MKQKLSQFGLAGVLVLTMIMPGLAPGAETFQLGEGQWLNVADSPDSEYIQAISNLKQQVSKSEVNAVNDSILKMKSDFPERTGPDFDSYLKGEVLYANAKWAKAVNAYDVFLDTFPNSPLYESALERQLSIATAYLNGQKRIVLKFIKLSAIGDAAEDAPAIIYKVVDRVGDSPMAQRALILLANSYSKNKAYLDARETWSEINFRWSTGQIGQESLLQLAYNSHSAYDGPRYDHTAITSARTYYTQFKTRYPDLVGPNQIDQKINMVDEQLAYKQYTIGDYYSRTDHPEAAEMYYKYVVEKWPGSGAAEMAQAKLDNEPVTIISVEKPGRKLKKKGMFDGLGKTLFNVSNKFVDSWPNFEKMLSKKTMVETGQ